MSFTEALQRVDDIQSRLSTMRTASVGATGGNFGASLATAVDRFGNGPTHISQPQDGSGASIRLTSPTNLDGPGAARIRSSSTPGTSSGVSAAAAAGAYSGGATGVTSSAGAPTSGMSPSLSAVFDRLSAKYDVPVGLAKAVARAESGFRSDAVSPVGAQGLMQLMPSTARGLGVTDSFDPEQNAEGGIKYLKGLLDRFHGDPKLALAAYNAGPNAVAKFGGIPPYAETRSYVTRVLGYAQEFGYVAPSEGDRTQGSTIGNPEPTS